MLDGISCGLEIEIRHAFEAYRLDAYMPANMWKLDVELSCDRLLQVIVDVPLDIALGCGDVFWEVGEKLRYLRSVPLL